MSKAPSASIADKNGRIILDGIKGVRIYAHDTVEITLTDKELALLRKNA